MNDRKYGPEPYRCIILHGGPGAPGSVGPLAETLSKERSMLEPFQSADSVEGQIQELEKYIEQNAQIPVIMIGHSWGAWLAFLFSARYPEQVGKLILVSAGPFEEKYEDSAIQTRLDRLLPAEKKIYDQIVRQWDHVNLHEKKLLFKRIGEMMLKVDGFDLENLTDSTIDYQPSLFEKVWNEASYLRSSGKLLEEGKKIRCPVVAIHGDFDPHPWEGVKEPLEKILPHFDFFLLKDCGHEPWMEKRAKDRFYRIILEAGIS